MATVAVVAFDRGWVNCGFSWRGDEALQASLMSHDARSGLAWVLLLSWSSVASEVSVGLRIYSHLPTNVKRPGSGRHGRLGFPPWQTGSEVAAVAP